MTRGIVLLDAVVAIGLMGGLLFGAHQLLSPLLNLSRDLATLESAHHTARNAFETVYAGETVSGVQSSAGPHETTKIVIPLPFYGEFVTYVAN